MRIAEGDMEMVNIHDLTMLQHAWVQGGRCQRAILLKKRFPPKLDFPQHRTNGGRGIGSGKSSYAASVPETFDAPKNRELFGTLGGRDGTQPLRGAEILLARARFILGLAFTAPGASRLTRKYDPLFSHGKVRFFPMVCAPAAS